MLKVLVNNFVVLRIIEEIMTQGMLVFYHQSHEGQVILDSSFEQVSRIAVSAVLACLQEKIRTCLTTSLAYRIILRLERPHCLRVGRLSRYRLAWGEDARELFIAAMFWRAFQLQLCGVMKALDRPLRMEVDQRQDRGHWNAYCS